VPRFFYKAKDGPDRTVEGEISADNQAEAAARVDRMGLTPLYVAEQRAESWDASFTVAGIRPRDVNVFTRQLASLLKAGVPILRALITLEDQTDNPKMRRLTGRVLATVRDGRLLSEALTPYPALFPDLYLSMVRSGESGGVLDEMLSRLAEAREREEEISARVRSALAYPILVLIVGVLTVFVTLAFFLPRIARLFEGAHQVLPLPTRILLAISAFFSSYWLWLLGFVAVVCILARRVTASGRGRFLSDQMLLRLPVIGPFLLEADLARFARTLSLLVQVGISLDKALGLSGKVLTNSVLRAEIDRIRDDTVHRGQPMATGLKRSPSIPPFVANMVAVGEESGRIDESLAEVAAFYQRQLDQRIKLATSLLEPLLILAVGSIVGFIIFAILLPVFQIGQGLR
jgi:type II secretory pathway component PulF